MRHAVSEQWILGELTSYTKQVVTYPLVMTNIAVENHHFIWENPLFRLGHFPAGYVCLPEGKSH